MYPVFLLYRVFNPTKNLLADTFLLVLDDTKWFLLYVLLIMLGFMFAVRGLGSSAVILESDTAARQEGITASGP